MSLNDQIKQAMKQQEQAAKQMKSSMDQMIDIARRSVEEMTDQNDKSFAVEFLKKIDNNTLTVEDLNELEKRKLNAR